MRRTIWLKFYQASKSPRSFSSHLLSQSFHRRKLFSEACKMISRSIYQIFSRNMASDPLDLFELINPHR
jgi:hypothetical protein